MIRQVMRISQQLAFIPCLLNVSIVFVVFSPQIPDQCGTDGFYYKDARSFVICSNGNAYVQPCAPGSRNSGNYK